MEVKGIVKQVGEIQDFNGFKKRELWIVTDETYPQTLNLEFVQDKVHILNNYKEGDKVEVSINLRGKEWTGADGVAKVFNSIQGWRISLEGGSLPNSMDEDDADSLPF